MGMHSWGTAQGLDRAPLAPLRLSHPANPPGQPTEAMASSSSAPAPHAWEEANYHPWEAAGYSDSDEEADPERDAVAASKLFLDELVGLYLESRASAQHLCTMCYWAVRGGMKGSLIAELALKPGQSSGNYQRHVDLVMGFDYVKEKSFPVSCPGRPRGSAFGRATHILPFRPPHEVLHDELVEDGSVLLKLQERLDDGALPPAYTEHPVVREADSPVVPVALYMEGVPYTKTDSVVGVWLENTVTKSRALLGLVRKSIACKCGCR
eukprot:9994258-Alexandrium_andersonii.AAC.1